MKTLEPLPPPENPVASSDATAPRDPVAVSEEARRSERERSAHRTFPVVATPADRHFVRAFLIAFLSLLVGVLGMNVLVDPLGYFGVGLLPRASWDDRDEKAKMFLSQNLRPGLLVLGSSRTMKLDPACASALTGLPAFNFGVSGGRPEDFYAIQQFVDASAGNSVKRIILGVEPDILLDDVSLGAFARQSRYLGRYVRADRPPPQEIAAALFGQGATLLSVASLVHAARGNAAAPPPIQLRADGMLFYTRDEEAVRRGVFDQNARIVAQMPGLRQAFADAHHLSPEREQLLRRLLVQARTRGIRVDAFIPPTQPAAAEALRGTAYQARLHETERLMQTLASEGLLVYHGTIPGERIGITADGYFDAYHLMQPNANRLLEAVLGGQARCALQ